MGILLTSLAIMAIIAGIFIYLKSLPKKTLTIGESLDAVARNEGFVNWDSLVKISSKYGNTKYIDTCYEAAWYLYIQNN